tara:strand:+ start:378 stop:1451 length:1074 start_codon:yes stop_codon:yes gene_type:complete
MKNKNIVVIAEAGVNHNGKIKYAYKLIDIAANSGANYVKFQIFKTNSVVTLNSPLAKYQKNKDSKSQYDLIHKLELSENDFLKLKKYSDKKKIKFLCTPFDLNSLEFLIKKLKLSLIKLSSGDITNYPLIYQIGKYHKKIIISSGNSDLKEITQAINFYIYGYLNKKNFNYVEFKKIDFKSFYNQFSNKIILLHCISQYPTNLKDLNLKSISFLKNKFPYFDIGLSDHSVEIETPLLAYAIGAKYIEKHFTINNNLPGPDHRASIEPSDLKKMIFLLDTFKDSLGDYTKKSFNSEKDNLKIVRRSIYASKEIKKGDKFTLSNIELKRPYRSKSNPFNYWKLLNIKAKRDFMKDELIS